MVRLLFLAADAGDVVVNGWEDICSICRKKIILKFALFKKWWYLNF